MAIAHRADWLAAAAGTRMCLGSSVGSRGSEVWAIWGCWQPGRMARGWAGFSEEELRRLKENKGNRQCPRRVSSCVRHGEGAGLQPSRGRGRGGGYCACDRGRGSKWQDGTAGAP